MKFTLVTDRLFSVAIALLMVILTIVIVFAIGQSGQLKKSAQLVAHTEKILYQSEKILSQVLNSETSSRGFALTGMPTHEAQMQLAHQNLEEEINALQTLTEDNPKQQAAIEQLRQLIRNRIHISELNVLIRRQFGKDSVSNYMAGGQGKLYSDSIRKQISDIQSKENILLVQRRLSADAASNTHNQILFGLIVGIILLLGIFLFKAIHDYKEKAATALELAQFNSHLEQKISERTDDLTRSNQQLEDTLLRINDGYVLLDNQWRYVRVNKRIGELVDMDPETMIGKNIWELFPDAVGSKTYEVLHKAKETQQYQTNEDYFEPLDLWQENHVYPTANGLSVYIRNITERKKAEEQILKTNRLYLFISQINQMIVRIDNQNTLFYEACQIAVNLGKFRMAWIGLVDTASNRLVPVMHAGEEREYLEKIKIIYLDDTVAPIGPTGKALRAGKYMVCNNIEQDPQMAPWKEAALDRGYLSSMALPLIKFGQVIGSFTFYAPTKNFFDASEIALLEEATGDVAFALENIDKDNQRKKALEQLNESNERFELIARATNDVVWDWDLITNYLWRNNNYYTHFQYDKSTTPPDIKEWEQHLHPDDRAAVVAGLQYSIESGKNHWSDEYRFLKKDGTVVYIIDRGFILRDQQGKPYRVIGSMFDATSLKKAQYAIISEKNLSDSIINSLPGVFYLYNRQGKFLRWNKNFETVTGYSNDEVKRMHPLDFFTKEEKALLSEKIANVFLTGEDSVLANFLQKSGATVPFYFTGTDIEYEGEQCLLGVGIDFSERIKAQEEIKLTTQKLHELTAHLQMIREEERKRIGREIHDELGQQLTAIKLDVSWIDKKLQGEEELIKSKLKNIIRMLDGSNQAIGRILSELRPVVLDDKGLLEALEWLADQFQKNTGIKIQLKHNLHQTRMPEDISIALFRIFQEAITNITRYAKASDVMVTIELHSDFLQLHIQDNGVGFDVQQVQEKKSFGIMGMKERALSLNGYFEIDSEIGKGTSLFISIPLTNPS